MRPRVDQATAHDDFLAGETGLAVDWIHRGIESAYDTLDTIDEQLTAKGSDPLSGIVELANLSSMLGNLLGAGLAEASDGRYVRNRPHAFPDLVPLDDSLPRIEIKTALETNKPKGHLPKAGFYLTFRYVLGDGDGNFEIGKEHRGDTVWIWEVRAGELGESDFDLSNTPGDSGKTAVVKTESFKNMRRLIYTSEHLPYKRRNAWYGDAPLD